MLKYISNKVKISYLEFEISFKEFRKSGLTFMGNRIFSAEEIKRLQAAEEVYTFLCKSNANAEMVRMVVKDLPIDELKFLVDAGRELLYDAYTGEVVKVLSERIIASSQVIMKKLEEAKVDIEFDSLVEGLGRNFFENLKNNLEYIKDENVVELYERIISKVLDSSKRVGNI